MATSSLNLQHPDYWKGFEEQLASLVANIRRVVVASDNTVRLSLVALYSEGHVLIEDLPGVGKTLLAKTIARSIDAKSPASSLPPTSYRLT